MAGLFVAWLLIASAVGLLERPDLRYWPFLVSTPAALVLAFIMPLLGAIGSVMARREHLKARIAGAIALSLAAVLWLLVLTAPPAGI